MRVTSINTAYNITNKKYLERLNNGQKIDNLTINPYVEENDTRHITINISPTICIIEDGEVDIWIDIDIYQAELLGKRILSLVADRKEYLEAKLNEE